MDGSRLLTIAELIDYLRPFAQSSWVVLSSDDYRNLPREGDYVDLRNLTHTLKPTK